MTYSDAGVDIDAGEALVTAIKPLAKSTNRRGVMGGLGGFGGLFDLKAAGFNDPILVASTDGVGTKLKIAIESSCHQGVGIDLVAMCANDLVVQGAQPLLFLDYYATGQLNVEEATAIVASIAEGCLQADCALIGGETAEMPGMYNDGDYDLAGFCVGAVERGKLLPRSDIAEGDVILGLASSGIHSNGYSLVRKLVEKSGLSYDSDSPFSSDKNFGKTLLKPTRIYVKSCLKAIKTGNVKGLAHITGGGLLENIPRILPESLVAEIDARRWPLPPVFQWLKKTGKITSENLARTFNCGIGMVLVCAPNQVGKVAEILNNEGEKVFEIGSLRARKDDEAQTQILNLDEQWS